MREHQTLTFKILAISPEVARDPENGRALLNINSLAAPQQGQRTIRLPDEPLRPVTLANLHQLLLQNA